MKLTKKLGVLTLIVIIGLFAANYVSNRNSSRNEYVSVFFVKYNNKALEERVIPVKRPIKQNENHINTAINELLKGPSVEEKQQGFVTEIPKGTKVITVTSNETYATINLSKEFQSGGGSESMTKRLSQVSKTAMENSDNKPVYLEIEGKKVKYLGGEGVEITQPLSFKKK